jgi:peptidoglycan/LPS O-acetylase OafA/YrhL
LQNKPAHTNNFDFLRFLFASFVIFSHSYALLYGDITRDPLYKAVGRVFSEIGVCGFFTISGFLIHQSLQRSSTLFSFFRKRLLRVIPGLVVAVLFTAFIIGPMVSSLNPTVYFGQAGTWKYVFSNVVLMPGNQELPGVFVHNPETAANGSLWTLRYELLLYAFLGTLFIVSLRLKKVIVPVLLTLLLGLFFALRYHLFFLPAEAHKFLYYFSILGSYFLGGTLLSLFSEEVKHLKTPLLLVSTGIFIFALFFFVRELEVIGILAFVVMVITFGLHYFPFLNFSRYTGDISYGTYIYAYPLQQALIVWLHPQNAVALMIPSFLISWLAGLLSWHLVEKRFIRRKA